MQRSFHPFQLLLQQAGDELPDLVQLEAVPAALEAGAFRLRDALILIGDECFSLPESMKPGQAGEAEALFLQFELAGRVKLLLILHRDMLFQHLKGKALHAEGKLSEEALRNHWADSRQVLSGAYEELGNWLLERLESFPPPRKQLAQWRLQNTPWPLYRQQLEVLCGQFGFLQKNAASFLSGIQTFQQIAGLIGLTVADCMEEIRKLGAQAGEVLEWLAQAGNKPARIAAQLETVNEGMLVPRHPETFTRQLESQSLKLPEKWQVAVGTDGGLVQHVDVELRRRTGQWLEGEVLPLLYEVWELTEAAHNDLKLSLSNIRNRLLLLTDDKEPIPGSPFTQPLVRSQAVMADSLTQCGELKALLEERLKAHFSLSDIYKDPRSFLPLSVQTAVRQLGISQSRTLQRGIRWLAGRTAVVRNLWKSVEREERLGFSEKTARYLEARQPDPSNSHYVPIFLTQGFVGASFAVGREMEMDHLHNLVRQWQSGFRGAAIISGSRFSGKTFFGEWAATRFFPGNLIRLSTTQTTIVKGRKLPATCDLGAVLDFLKKYALDARPLIWIDDLELWQDVGHTLFENARALVRFNDHYATRCFLLVSMNRWTRSLLQVQLGFDNAFQAFFEMGGLSREEMENAILIRHGATHRKLVQADGQPLSAGQAASIINRVRRAAGGNIGETLQWWTAAIRTYDDDSVRSLFSDHYPVPELPPMQDPDMALVLQEVLFQKKTDEYRLRKQFGPAFQERYAHLVRRLLALGLLDRLPDGGLQIRETAANAIADQLETSKL